MAKTMSLHAGIQPLVAQLGVVPNSDTFHIPEAGPGTTRWARSFPTAVPTTLFQYTCSHVRGEQACKKTFSRQCDLSRHQRYHTRPAKCKECNKGFSSLKDLERHDNSVHHTKVKYYCTNDWCRDSIRGLINGTVWGFRRKDHWQKHMKDEHHLNSQALQELQKNGIPMAILKEEEWMAILPKGTSS